MSDTGFAATPSPPYFAVIFTSRRTEGHKGYAEIANRMVELATQQPGFLGVESVRANDGLGITVSYWADEDAVRRWKQDAEHQIAQQTGKSTWYQDYIVRIAKVERDYSQSTAEGSG